MENRIGENLAAKTHEKADEVIQEKKKKEISSQIRSGGTAIKWEIELASLDERLDGEMKKVLRVLVWIPVWAAGLTV